ncbi:galactokinase [Salinibacterium sp. NSLL150]|uniref:galactokinase n=1 Tax=unclassified Salinibacterium TaxID=2632331 RepID=UPI0018CF8DC1|nr:MULTISPECIES: galactokinase [unclassified Salinibacterium]MBH0099410.1 galactokinase [Salinibacterium sp. NSLL35]MBH0102164.1 galactokinase [Salinibacterium sp. NSLL150]MBH0104924.1 galactokinase [Salinibacterium sp. NSLL16]MBH0107684.1 galactokinase [Salinibacterium sp. NSLL17]
MSDTVQQLRKRFSELTGHEPDGVWSAPGRVNLIGEHTDYNEGFVLPFAIDRRTRAAVGLRADGVIRVTSTFDDTSIEVPLSGLDAARSAGEIVGWSAYPLGVAWALGQHGADLNGVPGVDILIDSTVPVGAGLSSSAAIESSVALALNDLWKLGFSREQLAKVGQLAENEVVGAPTGIMDQSASLLGATDSAVFLDCRSLDVEVVPLGLAPAELSILVMDTRVSHSHATGGYSERRASCEAGAAALGASSLRDVSVADLERAQEILDDVTFRRVRHVVTENQRVLDTVRALNEEGPLAIGALLDASHVSMRDDFEISIPELDLAVETAREHGAIGARMTGGGFGGAAIALVPHARVSEVEVAVKEAFAARGFTEPMTFTVTPSQGAERNDAD